MSCQKSKNFEIAKNLLYPDVKARSAFKLVPWFHCIYMISDISFHGYYFHEIIFIRYLRSLC